LITFSLLKVSSFFIYTRTSLILYNQNPNFKIGQNLPPPFDQAHDQAQSTPSPKKIIYRQQSRLPQVILK